MEPKPVDVGLGQPGVVERALGALVVELERGLGVDAPAVGQRRTHDRHSSRHSYRSLQSMRFPDSNVFCPSAIESGFVPIATYA